VATSALQRHLRLIRRQPIFVPPPVESMDPLWSDPERFLVESRLEVAVSGGPQKVKRELTLLLERTQADELIFTSDLYDHDARLRSFQLTAEAMQAIR